MQRRMFKPFVGSCYREGIRGKKILVLGAGFYCNHADCIYYKQCTDVGRKDSSPYDSICPIYIKVGKRLSNEPSYCIEERPRSYRLFAKALQAFTQTDSYEETWSLLAFTNYIQFFLPGAAGKCSVTPFSDISARDFGAFIETVDELRPDIVIVWGCVINSSLKENNPYLVSLKELDETEWYLCHILVPGHDHPIAIVNPFHPSSSAWNGTLPVLKKYIAMALDE